MDYIIEGLYYYYDGKNLLRSVRCLKGLNADMKFTFSRPYDGGALK